MMLRSAGFTYREFPNSCYALHSCLLSPHRQDKDPGLPRRLASGALSPLTTDVAMVLGRCNLDASKTTTT